MPALVESITADGNQGWVEVRAGEYTLQFEFFGTAVGTITLFGRNSSTSPEYQFRMADDTLLSVTDNRRYNYRFNGGQVEARAASTTVDATNYIRVAMERTVAASAF